MVSRPVTLRLPPTLARRGFNLARLIAESHVAGSWADGWALLEEFALSGPERAFALALLRAKTNLWLYRCNQRCAAGDFVVVDMSPPRPAWRVAVVVELKQGQELGEGGGVQLAHHEAAVAELIAAGVLAAASETRLLCGAPEEVLALLGVRRP